MPLVALVAAHAGGIPFVGGIPVGLAPNILLVGLTLLVVSALCVVTERWAIIIAVAGVVGVSLGVNSRIPEVWRDARTKWFEVAVTERFAGTVGDPLVVRFSGPPVAARRFAYASVRPACGDMNCFSLNGFRTPLPGLRSEYWSEGPAVAAAAGFGIVQDDEKAMALIVTTRGERDLLVVRMELRSADGRVLSSGTAKYRVGFTGEVVDGERPEWPKSSFDLVLSFLFHNNIVNRIVGEAVAPTVANPIQTFLKEASVLTHPQDATAPTVLLGHEVVREQRYAPPRVVRGSGEQNERTTFFWDEVREKHCWDLMRQESKEPGMNVWLLFVNDPTGRRKARFSGPGICDPDAIWFFDYVAMPGHVVLTKFDIRGVVVYRIAVKRPDDSSFVRTPSLRSSGGVLEFEWWAGTNSGADFHVVSLVAIKVIEPR